MAWFASLAMFLAAAQRCSFSVLALPIQAQLGLSLAQMGVLQSSMLLGYVIGQVSHAHKYAQDPVAHARARASCHQPYNPKHP